MEVTVDTIGSALLNIKSFILDVLINDASVFVWVL